MKKKFKSIVMNVCGFTALLLSSAAVAAPTYTVAWYANPCVTNVAYDASAVFAQDESAASLVSAWETVKNDANIDGKTVVSKRMSHSDYFRPRFYALCSDGTIAIYTLSRDLSGIVWTTVYSSAELIALVNGNGGELESARTVTAFEVVDKDGAVAFVKFGEDADYVALANTPPRWTYYAAGAEGNPSAGKIGCITDGRWVLKCRTKDIKTKGIEIGSYTASDFAYLNDYRGEYLDLSRGEAVNGSGTTKIGDCIYSLTNGTRVLVHSKNLYNPPNSAGFKTCHAEELIINSSTVEEMQSWSAATVLRVVFNLPNFKNARYYMFGRTGVPSANFGEETDFGDFNLPALSTVSNCAFRFFAAHGALSLPAAKKVYAEAFYGCDNLEEVKLSPEKRTLSLIGSGAFAASTDRGKGKLKRVTLGCAEGFTFAVNNAFARQPLEVVTLTGAVPLFEKTEVWPDSLARAMVFAIPEGDAAWAEIVSGATVLSEEERKACHAAHPDWPIPFAVVDKSVFKTRHEQYLAYIGSDKGVSLAIDRDTFFDDTVTVETDWAAFADGTYPKGTVVTLTAAAGSTGRFMKWYGDVPGAVSSEQSVELTLSGDSWVYARFVHPWTLSSDRTKMSNGNFTVNCSVVDAAKRTLQVGINYKYAGVGGIYADDNGSGVLDLGGDIKGSDDAQLWKIVRLSAGDAAWTAPTSGKVKAFITPSTMDRASENLESQMLNRGNGVSYSTLIIDEPSAQWGWKGEWYCTQNKLERFVFRVPKLTAMSGDNGMSGGANLTGTKLDWWDLGAVASIGGNTLRINAGNQLRLPASGTFSLPSFRSVAGTEFQRMENVEGFVLGGKTKALTVTNIAANAFAYDKSLKRLVLHADAEIVVGATPFANGRTPDEIVLTGMPPENSEVYENLLSGVRKGDAPVVIRIPRGSWAWAQAPGIDHSPTSAEKALAGDESKKVFGVVRGNADGVPYVKALCLFDEPLSGMVIKIR